MKANTKNIPTLRFPEFEGEWNRKRLSELSTLITKGTTPSKFVKSGIKFVKIECFKDDNIDIEKCLFIDDTTHNKELKRSILREDDILFAIAGATIGKCNIVPKEILPANTNQALSIIRLNTDSNVRFTYYNLKSDIMQKYIIENISVGAQPNLNLEQMGNFSFYLPNKAEQQKIADFLTAVDRHIQQLTKKKQLLEQYKKGVMQQLFSQQLRFKDENGNYYPDWEEKKLGDLADITKGQQLNKDLLSANGKYPALNGGIEASGYTDNWNKESETISISEGGNSCGFVNFNKSRFWSGGHCYTLDNLKRFIVNPYLFQYLKFKQNEIMRLRVGSGLPNIQKKALTSFIIAIPNVHEQQKIANFLSSVDNKIEKVQKQIDKTQAFKKGLLQQMFV